MKTVLLLKEKDIFYWYNYISRNIKFLVTVKNDNEEIEIEFKLRENKDYYMKTLNRVHDFLDNKLPLSNKKIITFIKLKLKEQKDKKEYYNSFKVFYYHYGQGCAMNKELLYPLI